MSEKPSRRRTASSNATPASPLAAVSELLSERSKYEKWLVELESRRGSTPPKAFERVWNDYTTRLNEVLAKLGEHQESLTQHATALEQKLAQLEESREELDERRAESSLRAEVGELSAAEWDVISKRIEKELTKLAIDHASSTTELERIRELLSGVTPAHGTPAVPAEDTTSQVDADIAAGDDEDETRPSDGKPAAKKAAAAKSGKEVDELEFLKSVVGGSTPTGSEAAPSGGGANAPDPAMAARRRTGSIEESSLPSVGSATPVVSPAVPDDGEPPAQAPASRKAGGAPARGAAKKPDAKQKDSLVEQPKEADTLKSAKQPLSMNVTDATPLVIKSSETSSVQGKTARCAECGAANYPSEWYCERCGAEMTNV